MEGAFPGPGRRTDLLERGRECALLHRLLSDIRQGLSRSLVLRGEAGIGKPALLEYLIEQAYDLRMLRAVGVESEMEWAAGRRHDRASGRSVGRCPAPSPADAPPCRLVRRRRAPASDRRPGRAARAGLRGRSRSPARARRPANRARLPLAPAAVSRAGSGLSPSLAGITPLTAARIRRIIRLADDPPVLARRIVEAVERAAGDPHDPGVEIVEGAQIRLAEHRCPDRLQRVERVGASMIP